MKFKHSPAPWVAAEFLDGFNIKDEKYGRHIAFTPKQNNAHLIAAAPELLSELIRLRNIVASYKQDSGDNLDITDAVIAKALSQQ